MAFKTGIGAGIILSETGKSEDSIAAVVLQGMAAGTLLYVVFFEVLAREKINRHSGVWQLCAILAGFGIMLTLQMISEFFWFGLSFGYKFILVLASFFLLCGLSNTFLKNVRRPCLEKTERIMSLLKKKCTKLQLPRCFRISDI